MRFFLSGLLVTFVVSGLFSNIAYCIAQNSSEFENSDQKSRYKDRIIVHSDLMALSGFDTLNLGLTYAMFSKLGLSIEGETARTGYYYQHEIKRSIGLSLPFFVIGKVSGSGIYISPTYKWNAVYYDYAYSDSIDREYDRSFESFKVSAGVQLLLFKKLVVSPGVGFETLERVSLDRVLKIDGGTTFDDIGDFFRKPRIEVKIGYKF